MAGKKQIGPTLEAVLTANVTKFEKGMLKAQQLLQRTADKFTKIGKQMTLAVTVPLAALGTAAVKAFADFDDAMTKSTAIMVGLTGTMRTEMEALAQDLAGKGVQSATELAQSYFFLASAGLSAKQSMDSLSAVQDFATAGNFDMSTATDLLTDAQTALGMSSKDPDTNLRNMIALSDQLVKANTAANASVQQFSESLTSDAAVASRGFGMELDTTMAVLNAYASAGKKGAEAGNLFGRATRLMADAAMENAGAFKALEIDVTDADGNYRNFIDIIADIEEGFEGLSESAVKAKLKGLGFASLAQKSITPLIGMSDAMREWEKGQRAATGFTKDVATAQLKSFTSQMKMLWNQLTVIRIEIGKGLVPILKVMITVIKQGISIWKSMDVATRKWVIAIGVVIAAIGPMLLALALMQKAIIGLNIAILALSGNPVILAFAVVAASAAILLGVLSSNAEEAEKLAKALETVGDVDFPMPAKMSDEEAKNMFGGANESKKIESSARADRVKVFNDLQKQWRVALNMKEVELAFGRIASTLGVVGNVFGNIVTQTKSLFGVGDPTRFSSASTFTGRTASQELGVGGTPNSVPNQQLAEAKVTNDLLKEMDKRGRRQGYINEELVVGPS